MAQPAEAMPSGLSAISPPVPLSARLLAKPFIDRLCLWGFRWMLPASHAWATAAAAEGDMERFLAMLGRGRGNGKLRGRVARTAALQAAARSAFEIWRGAAFDDAAGTPEMLAEIELMRRRTAQAFSSQRTSYFGFAKWHGLPAAPYQISEPEAALADLPSGRTKAASLFAAPAAMPAIEVSRRAILRGVAEYWLRFPSVDAAGNSDTAWVHVYEPLNAPANTPSLIWAHGLAMELEMMEAGPLDFLSLVRAGIRVLMPDAPGHNRRVQAGFYGGEAFLRAAPISSLQHFRQTAREFASLIDWCRAAGSARVALGGISLGALSAQVAAGYMQDWPSSCRPDALLLLTTTDRVSELVTDSALGQVADVDRAVLAAGWRAEHVARLADITDAPAAAPLDPARIVMLIGRRDNVTPYAGGLRLARQWQLPAANIFTRDQGHFSAAFGLAIDPAPYRRLIEILKD